MRVLTVIARWVFILCLPVLLLSASIGVAFNSLWLYEYSLEKDNAGQVTGLSSTELEKAARGLITYFDNGQDVINLVVEKDGRPFTMFNQREVIHLKDVKTLVWLDYKILLITLLYVLGYSIYYLRQRDKWSYLAQTVLIGSGVTLTLMLAFGLGILFNFDQLLLQFHLLSFSNDFWQLEAGDYLLLFFPGFEAALFVAIATITGAVILAGASWGHLRFNERDRSA